ncbi:kinase domain-containing protein [Pochonia chlamydosporia 170]|uniref:Kinase domain-containing protein n=1 Tax=Pochonia chlamydosporia 170 TaxID=1380566 RepID=A0A179F601_METCM|nr:kinase domain-containing protein [Pochonia chlamydosporia 170]OAQ60866.2 kinase domain-containing protein [Pochonia chlamydosporia 170]
MASERESRIDLGRLGTQPSGRQPETKHNAGVSSNSPAQNRLKKVPQQGETPHGKTTAALSKKPKSPWTGYIKLYSLQFGASDYFQVAEEVFKKKDSNPDHNPVVIVKSFSNAEAKSCMQYIQRINHKNFVPVRNFFSTNGESFIAFEFMPLSLSELAGHPLMDDCRLASILGQIVDGLVYLDDHCLEHTQLTCSNILVDTAGNVKLWAQEHVQGGSDRKRHVQGLRRIAIQLIQGYIDEDEPDGPGGIPQCPDGLKFVSDMERASSTESLKKHSLLQLPWHKSRLAGMISLVHIWVDRGYKFHP